MKRYLILSFVVLALSACGGSGGGGGGGGGEGDFVTPNTMPTASGSTLADIATAVVSANPSGGDSAAPSKGEEPITDPRFDEHGNIKGVYGIPYVPAKKNIGNP